MTITSAIVLYAVIWFLVLFLVLPFRLVTQGEQGEVVPGTPESAPHEAQMGRKLRLATFIATLVWAAVAANTQIINEATLSYGTGADTCTATAAVTVTDPCAGRMTPVAPAPAAERMTAPRFRGSVTWSRQQRRGVGWAASSQASAYGYGAHQATTPW